MAQPESGGGDRWMNASDALLMMLAIIFIIAAFCIRPDD